MAGRCATYFTPFNMFVAQKEGWGRDGMGTEGMGYRSDLSQEFAEGVTILWYCVAEVKPGVAGRVRK